MSWLGEDLPAIKNFLSVPFEVLLILAAHSRYTGNTFEDNKKVLTY
jgi:hypothetical protein